MSVEVAPTSLSPSGRGTYEHFASRDPLSRLVLEQMLAAVSTRRLEDTCDLSLPLLQGRGGGTLWSN